MLKKLDTLLGHEALNLLLPNESKGQQMAALLQILQFGLGGRGEL